MTLVEREWRWLTWVAGMTGLGTAPSLEIFRQDWRRFLRTRRLIVRLWGGLAGVGAGAGSWKWRITGATTLRYIWALPLSLTPTHWTNPVNPDAFGTHTTVQRVPSGVSSNQS